MKTMNEKELIAYYTRLDKISKITHIAHPLLNKDGVKTIGDVYFVFGDVHGEYDMMMDALDRAGFDILNPFHNILSLGDNFDRGKQNLRVYEFLMWMLKEKRVKLIQGNHDDFFADVYLDNEESVQFNLRYNGFERTLGEFTGIDHWKVRKASLARMRTDLNRHKMKDYLGAMVHQVQLGRYSFTHAGYAHVNGTWELSNWARTDHFVKYYRTFGRTEVFGHWGAFKLYPESQKVEPGMPYLSDYGGFIGLDAWCGVSGHVLVAKFGVPEGAKHGEDYELLLIR